MAWPVPDVLGLRHSDRGTECSLLSLGRWARVVTFDAKITAKDFPGEHAFLTSVLPCPFQRLEAAVREAVGEIDQVILNGLSGHVAPTSGRFGDRREDCVHSCFTKL
jgi:hypothetical protein